MFTEPTSAGYDELKGFCEALNGTIASKDLKDRLLANFLKINYVLKKFEITTIPAKKQNFKKDCSKLIDLFLCWQQQIYLKI